MKEDEMITLQRDRQLTAKLTKKLLELFDNAPIEEYLNIIDSFTMALIILCEHGKEQIESEEDDGIEKEVLNTFKKMSEGDKLSINFHKYIKL